MKVNPGSSNFSNYEFFLRDYMNSIIGWNIGYPTNWSRKKCDLRNPDRNSLKKISNCDSTAAWSGTSVSLDTNDKVEGTASIKDTVSSPSNDTDYSTIYNPASLIDMAWWPYAKIRFYIKSDRPSSAFSYTRLYVYDTSGNWRYWNFSFNADTWTTITLDRENYDGQSETAPNFYSIDKFEFVFHTSDTTSFYKKIDYIRLGEFDYDKVKRFHWLLKTSDSPVTFSMWADWMVVDDGPQWSTGKFDKALEFDGEDDYIEISNSTSLETFSAITVSCWFKAETLGDGKYFRHIIDKGWVSEGAWVIYTDKSTKKLNWELELDGIPRVTRSDEDLEKGVWYHVVGVYDGQKVQLYINGVKQILETSYTKESFSNTAPLKIGGSTNDHHGVIDEVRIYNRALTAEEIEGLYAAKMVQKGLVLCLDKKGLISNWDGTHWKDSSGHGNHGTIYGMKRVKCCPGWESPREI